MAIDVKRAAVLLAKRSGLPDVAPVDVREMAERGVLRVVVPGDWLLVGLDDLRAGWIDELRRIGEERRAWRAASLDRFDAAEVLGRSWKEFPELAAQRGVQPGRFGRYARSDIDWLRHALMAAGAARQMRAG
jgi:choline dehydrogenase-like flavoprotein